MDKFKRALMAKILVMTALLILGNVGVAQMARVITDVPLPVNDPYCGDGGYVESILGIQSTDSEFKCTPVENSAIPANVVDWVLVELRAVAEEAPATTRVEVVAREPALLIFTGHVLDAERYTDPDDTGNTCDNFVPNSEECPLVSFNFNADEFLDKELYVVVRHVNHLDVIADAALTTNTAGFYEHDFTQADDMGKEVIKAKGGSLALKRVPVNEGGSESVYRNAMYVGDINGDTNINAADYLEIYTVCGEDCNGQDSMSSIDDNRKIAADINYDGQVNEDDVMQTSILENLGRAVQNRCFDYPHASDEADPFKCNRRE